MSRVTKATKANRRKRAWNRPRKRVTHVRGRTIVYGPGRVTLNGKEIGTVTDISIDFGDTFREVSMTFEPVRAERTT